MRTSPPRAPLESSLACLSRRAATSSSGTAVPGHAITATSAPQPMSSETSSRRGGTRSITAESSVPPTRKGRNPSAKRQRREERRAGALVDEHRERHRRDDRAADRDRERDEQRPELARRQGRRGSASGRGSSMSASSAGRWPARETIRACAYLARVIALRLQRPRRPAGGAVRALAGLGDAVRRAYVRRRAGRARSTNPGTPLVAGEAARLRLDAAARRQPAARLRAGLPHAAAADPLAAAAGPAGGDPRDARRAGRARATTLPRDGRRRHGAARRSTRSSPIPRAPASCSPTGSTRRGGSSWRRSGRASPRSSTRDMAYRSRPPRGRGLRRVLDDLHPRIRWREGSVTVRRPERADGGSRRARARAHAERLRLARGRGGRGRAVAADDRLPRAGHRRAVARHRRRRPRALGRLLGRTRALLLPSLDEPASTTSARGAARPEPERRLPPPDRAPRRRARLRRRATGTRCATHGRGSAPTSSAAPGRAPLGDEAAASFSAPKGAI